MNRQTILDGLVLVAGLMGGAMLVALLIGAVTVPYETRAEAFISSMTDTGRDEMCEVWTQSSVAVYQRFTDLGLGWDDSVISVNQYCGGAGFVQHPQVP